MTFSSDSPPQITCSYASRSSTEQLFGTAPRIYSWMMLGYAHPLGSKAFEEALLPVTVQSHLKGTLESIPKSRLLLIRQPTVDRLPFLFARVDDTRPTLFEYQLENYEELLGIDFTNLAGDTSKDQVHQGKGSIWLVCTNGKRDPCCAQWGIPFFTALERDNPGRVYQSSHLGGHRFAANAVLFPQGIYYGRLTAESSLKLLSATQKGEILLENYRGRVSYSPEAQAAEYFLRANTGDLAINAFQLAGSNLVDELAWRVHFVHRESQAKHTLSISAAWSDFEIFESCSKPDKRSRKIQYFLQQHQIA